MIRQIAISPRKISHRYLVPAGPKWAARPSGNKSAIGPTKTSPETAKPSAAASRPPETTSGRRARLITPSSSK